MADNLRKYTTQEVLNKVFTDSSGNAIGINSSTTKETLNAVFSTSDNSLNVALSGGSISGDVTISGDLTVSGAGLQAFDEIIEGTQVIDVDSTEALLVRKNGDAGDIFTVDTTNSKVLVNNQLNVTGLSGDAARLYLFDVDNSTSEGEGFLIQKSGNNAYIENRADSGSINIGTGDRNDDLSISSSGNATFSGDVGINASPTSTYSLNVEKTDQNGLRIKAGSGSTGQYQIRSLDSDGNVDFVVRGDGNVGIGTASPGTNFHISKTSSDVGLRFTAVATSDARLADISFFNDTDSVGAIQAWRDGANDQMTLKFLTQSSADGNLERLVITHDGKVGIGTTSPTQKLHLSESASAIGLLVQGGGGGTAMARFQRNVGSTGIVNIHSSGGDPQITFNDETDAEVSIGVDASTNEFKVSRNSAIATNDDLIIDSSGNVGIGGVPSNILDIIKDATDGGETKFIRMLDADTDTTADTEMIISFQKYFDGTSSSDVGSIGVGLTGWGTVSTSRNTFMTFKTVASGSRVLNFKLDGNSRISLSNNDSGTSNTIFGKNAGDSDGAGDYNVFVGELAGGSGTQTDDADHNIGIGYNALNDLTTGDSNICIGSYSGDTLTESHNVVLIGRDSGTAVNSTDVNGLVAIGRRSATALTSGQENVAIGYQSLMETTTGDYNTAVGHNSMSQDASLANTYNTFMGRNSGGGDWTTGACSHNTGIGANSMGGAMNGSLNNTAVGSHSLEALTEGDDNTAVGAYALTDNLTGQYNIAIGVEALKNPQAPSKNIMIGYQAGLATTLNVPSQNIGVGYQALKSLSNGNYNVAMGTNAGDVITTGDNCVVIGHGADPSGADAQNQTVIGSSAIGAGDNSVVLGDSNVTSVLCASDGEAQLYASAIRFPATQVANGNANALDDYEEGTFTPAYTLSSVGDASWTHDRQIGRYTKVGNVVHFQCFVRTDAYSNSSGSGDLRISGLPFTSDSTTNVVTAVSVSAFGFASDNNPISARIVNGVNYISLYKRADANDGDTSLDQNSTLNGSNENSILIGGSYRTA
jgi:hypothetical protein